MTDLIKQVFAEKEQEISEKEREQLRENMQLRMDFLNTFGNPAGKRVLRYILEETGIFRANVETSAKIYRLEGYRAFGLKIAQWIPELVFELQLAEAHDDEFNPGFHTTWEMYQNEQAK